MLGKRGVTPKTRKTLGTTYFHFSGISRFKVSSKTGSQSKSSFSVFRHCRFCSKLLFMLFCKHIL